MLNEPSSSHSEIQIEDQDIVRSWLDVSPDVLVIIDLDGKVLYANQMAFALLVVSQDALVTTNLWDHYPQGKASHHKTIVSQVTRTGHPIRLTDQIGDRWDQVLFQPLLDLQGQVTHIVICHREITAQISAEEQLKRAKLQLITLQEDERRRISQDLHDDIGQTLTALLMNLTAIETAVNVGAKDVGEQIRSTLGMVEDLMKRIRQVFYRLRPPSLETLTLSQAMQSYCATYAKQTGLKVIFRGQDDLPTLTDLQATALYRFVQEGLNNAAKHARATAVWVNLARSDEGVDLAVEDDGQGFDPQVVSGSMGLQGIRNRFLMLGGSFEIESAPGKGTRLSGSLPIVSG